MMRLRSGSLKKEPRVIDKSPKARKLSRVDIPDLNLNDEVDVVSTEDGGKECCEVSKSEGKSNGSMCKGGVDFVQVESEKSNGDEVLMVYSSNIDVSGDGEESGVEKSKCGLDLVIADSLNWDGSLENDKCKTVSQEEEPVPINVVNQIDDESGFCSDIIVTVSENGKCNSNGKKVPENCEQSPRSKGEEGRFPLLGKVLRSRIVPAKPLGEDVGVVQIRSLSNKRKTRSDSPEKIEVTVKDVGSKVLCDSKTALCRRSPRRLKTLCDQSNGEVVDLNVRELNSKVSDANDVALRISGEKRKRGRPRKSIDPKTPVVHTQQVLAICEIKDKNAEDVRREQKSIDCSLEGSRKKRGRPRKLVDHPKDSELHACQVAVVSEIEDEDMGDISAVQTKMNRRREKKAIDCSEVEHEVRGDSDEKVRKLRKKSVDHSKDSELHACQVAVSEIEDEDMGDISTVKTRKYRHREKKAIDCSKVEHEVLGDSDEKVRKLRKKSVGNSSQTRKSERSKNIVDYCETEGVQRKKFSRCKIDYESSEDNERDLCKTKETSSKKKRKRGRPKKQLGNSPVMQISPNKTKTSDEPDIPGADTSLKGKEILKNENNSPVERKDGETSVSLVAEKSLILFGGEASMKGTSSGEKKTSDGLEFSEVDTSSKVEETLKDKKISSVKCKSGEASVPRAVEKNLIRNQIVDMLLHAGWTIEHKPRNGRDYYDSIYVNSKGQAYWSVTKAYFSLQQEFEKGNAEFSFTPLPEETLSKLYRVVTKIRSDKNVKRKHKGDGEPFDLKKRGPKTKTSVLKKKSSGQNETQSKRRCALVARRSKGLNSESVEAMACMGKHSIFAWLIDSGVVSLDAKVKYVNPDTTETMLEGKITRDGILCHCCKKKYSAVEFEKHSGSELCQPYENLLLESGQSLTQCKLDSWNKQDAARLKGFHSVIVDNDDPNDDTCAICGDGGDLMCCDGCPSTFHPDCLDMEEVPSGEWHCVFCSCKFCGEVETREIDDCDAFSSLVTCSLCQKKYHPSCADEEGVVYTESGREIFCGEICEQIFKKVQTLIGTKSDLDDGYSWTLLQRSDVKAVADSSEAKKIENNSKLAVALSVMDECFVPIIDPRSRINMIPHVMYNSGSNLTRVDFSSFFTVVLEKGDEVISAASIRIHGKQLAEMPFIATRNIYRRKGMCRRLLTAIELALGSLEIENLVIPAIPALLSTWTSVFGFQPLEDTVREEMRSMNMLVFAHTDMLQKPLPKQRLSIEGVSTLENTAEGTKSCNEPLDGEAGKKSKVDDDCFNVPFDLNVVAPDIPESSFDDKPVSVSDVEVEDIVKNGIDEGGLSNAGIADGVKNSGVAVTTSEGCVTTEYLEPSEPSCKTSFDGIESSSIALFLGSGVPKVGSN